MQIYTLSSMLLEFEHGINHLVESGTHFFVNVESHNECLVRLSCF